MERRLRSDPYSPMWLEILTMKCGYFFGEHRLINLNFSLLKERKHTPILVELEIRREIVGVSDLTHALSQKGVRDKNGDLVKLEEKEIEYLKHFAKMEQELKLKTVWLETKDVIENATITFEPRDR